MVDGTVHAGIIKGDDDNRLKIQLPDANFVFVDKTQIEDRTTGKSGMPDDVVKKLTKSEIRDVVEYLSTLKSERKPASERDQ